LKICGGGLESGGKKRGEGDRAAGKTKWVRTVSEGSVTQKQGKNMRGLSNGTGTGVYGTTGSFIAGVRKAATPNDREKG